MKKLKKNWTGERLETFVLNETMVEHLHRYSIVMSLVRNKQVLDIACGEGYGSKLMSSVAEHVTGVDIDKNVIDHAKQKYQSNNLIFIEGQADKIPLGVDSVDIVVSFETIEHHDKHDEMLIEIKRVLKPGGLLIMSSPEKKTDKSFNPYHIKELTRAEFKTLIGKYFSHSNFYNQKIVMGSLLVPEIATGTNFQTHSGNFDLLNSYEGLENSVFNLCIAGDDLTPEFSTSFFDGQDILKNQIALPYTNSKVYKAFQFFKSFF